MSPEQREEFDKEFPNFSAYIKKHYRIGEEVEGRSDEGWRSATICAIVNCRNGFTIITNPEDVRIPSWEPKDGESVLFQKPGEQGAYPAVYHLGGVHLGKYHYSYTAGCCKPFDASKIGRRLEDI